MNDDPNLEISRSLLREAHKEVKEHFPGVHLRRDAWTYRISTGQWEFHGPDKFYWHGRADNGYDARYKGWVAWLQSKGDYT